MRGNKDLSNVHFHPKNVKNKFEKKHHLRFQTLKTFN